MKTKGILLMVLLLAMAAFAVPAFAEEDAGLISQCNGKGQVICTPQQPAAGERVSVQAEPAKGYYLAQIRLGTAQPSAEGEETEYSWQTLDLQGKGAEFDMPGGDAVVWADFISVTWDGTVDLTWYDPEETVYEIRYPAQLAGAAALNNGLFNDFPVREVKSGDETVRIPDLTDEDGKAVDLADSKKTGYLAAGDGSGYQVFADNDGDGIDTAVVGDLSLIQVGHQSGEVGGNNQVTSLVYWYGAEDYTDKTLSLAADLNMGGQLADGGRKTLLADWSGPNYMPIGGQYCMDKNNGYTRLTAGFNGYFEGNGHMVYNLFVNRHADTFGNCQAVGLIGLMGQYRVEDGRVSDPYVRGVAIDGFIYGNRSIGGIVGKTVHSKGSVIDSCMNFATIYNTDAKGCGGIVGAGWFERGYGDGQLVVENCANFGMVTTGYNKNAGGLVGSCEALVFDSYSTGYVCHDGKGEKSAGQALGTNNGGAVWYNCYALKGASSTETNTPGAMTPYVYGPTYGSAIRVLDGPAAMKGALSLLNGEVRYDGPDDNGYMDSDDDVIPDLKRNWVCGEETSAQQFCSPYLDQALRSVISWHDPSVEISGDFSQAGIAAQLSAADAYGMPIPRAFVLDGSQLQSIITTGTPTMDYLTGETFDTGDHTKQPESPEEADPDAEFAVWALFDDGSCQKLDDYEVVYENDAGEFTKAGETAVTVRGSYLGTSYAFPISGIQVTACQLLSMELTAEPNNTFYAAGEDFDPEGLFITEEYGLAGDVMMTIKARYEDGAFSITKTVPDTGHSDQSGQTKTVTVSGEAAKAYVYNFEEMTALEGGRTSVKVSHTFGETTMSCDIPITVLTDGAPRLVKDGENNRQIVYIDSESDFLWFANQVAAGLDPAMEAVLEKDIELSSENLAPVGVRTKNNKKTSVVYTGDFDGGGHKISLEMTQKNAYAGLFYSIGEKGKVHDLILTGSVSGGSYVGGIAAYLDGGKIEGCRNQAQISGTGSYIGGICGSVRAQASTIQSCQNQGSVSGAEYIGGIAGRVNGADVEISGCVNEGGISKASDSTKTGPIGGICGQLAEGTLQSCFSTGTMDLTGGDTSGGIAGQAAAASILRDCYSAAVITVSAPAAGETAGGIAGSTAAKATVINCYYAGRLNVKTADSDIATNQGALIGKAADGTNISGNYALADSAPALIISTRSSFVPSDENGMWKTEEEMKAASFAALLGEAYQSACGRFPQLAWETAVGHVEIAAKDKYQAADENQAESWEEVVTCSVCNEVLSRKSVTGPDAPASLKAAASYDSAKLTWTEASSADGYELWQKAGSEEYQLLARVKTNEFTAADLLTGTKYSWYVQAVSAENAHSKFSQAVSATPALAKVTGIKAKAGKKQATITWKKAAGASGYVVYRATKKNGKYKAVKTITRPATVKFVNKKLKKGKKFFYKVRAYRTVNKKKVYGAYSAVKAVKIK
ncbi:MAG: fibronectin type III domain-containing protein [Firmicutes bacterium]|nr:fibronectin type III domain-containing protein [Bacillota bacterium]